VLTILRAQTAAGFWIGVSLVVFLLPSANPSVDAASYGWSALMATDCLQPHHILHGLLGCKVWGPLLQKTGLLSSTGGVLAVEQVLAASNGVGFLFLLFFTNKVLGGQFARVHPLLWVVAGSWGLLRFSVEYEAYIWPLVFTVAGLYAQSRSRFWGAGICWAFALLFHQMAVLWVVAGLASALSTASKPALAKMIAPLLAVPVCYAVVFYLIQSAATLPHFTHFLLGEFGNGGVKTAYNLGHIGIWAISALRSMVQIHGYFVPAIIEVPKSFGLFLLMGVGAGALVFMLMGKNRASTSLRAAAAAGVVQIAGRCAFFGVLLLGLWAQGNAEFMGSLPLAAVLGWQGWLQKKETLMRWAAAGFFGWNLATGLLLMHFLQLSAYPAEAAFTSMAGHPLATYHKLEVVTWAGPQKRRPIIHAQFITSHGGNFYYKGDSLLADTLLYLEQMHKAPLSRASLLEAQSGTPPGLVGRVVVTWPHIGGPTRLVELRPFK